MGFPPMPITKEPPHTMGSLAVGLGALLGLIAYKFGMDHWRMRRLQHDWNTALAALEARDAAAAEAPLRRCVQREPLFVAARFALGDVLANAGKLEEAEEHLRMAAQLQPREAVGPLNLALFYALHCANREAEARAALEQALTLDPELPQKIDGNEKLQVLRTHPQFAGLLP